MAKLSRSVKQRGGSAHVQSCNFSTAYNISPFRRNDRGEIFKTLIILQSIKVAIPKCPPLSINKVIIFVLE